MAGMSPQLKLKLRNEPDAIVHLIIRVTDDPKLHIEHVQASGLKVYRTFTLIAAMAVEGKASVVLALTDQSWIVSVEEDKPVHTM
jgi:hypothetical protein